MIHSVNSGLKIAIAHFRIGLTDGVSLQINERVEILKKLHHNIVYIASPKSPLADLRISLFEYKDIQDINSLDKLEERVIRIKNDLTVFWEKEKFNYIFMHNFFSLPVCLPATLGFYRFLAENNSVRGIAVHHDFWWDPPRIKKSEIRNPKFENILNKYFPPELPNLQHTVISKWEQSELKKRKNIDSEVVTDTFDFELGEWKKNAANKNFLSDAGLQENQLKLLLAARIRERKGMELGIQFAHHLQKKISKKIVLLLPNDFFKQEKDYVNKLKKLAEDLRVEIRWLQDLVGSDEEKRSGAKKYSLWDSYVYSDVILYPSLWEGFGNQFLEAVFAKKPIVVFEYRVYHTDIKPYGFEVVSLGDKYSLKDSGLARVETGVLESSAEQLATVLADPDKLRQMSDTNFLTAKRNFNTRTVLKNYFAKILR